MAKLIGKVLHSLDSEKPDIKPDGKKSLVDVILEFAGDEFSLKGDRILVKEAQKFKQEDQIHAVQGTSG